MKIATAFYSESGVLLPLERFWEGEHETTTVLTVDAGYWHSCAKYFSTEAIRDAMAAEIITQIHDHNGTVFAEQRSDAPVDMEGGQAGWLYAVTYIIEERFRGRCFERAAIVAGHGKGWMRESEQYDPVAEHGPDYVDNLTDNNAYIYAHGVNALIKAKAEALGHEHFAQDQMLAAVQAQTQAIQQQAQLMQQLLALEQTRASSPGSGRAAITRTLTGDKAKQFVRDNPEKFRR